MHNNTDYEIYMVDDTPYGYIYELNVDNCNIKNGFDGIYNQNNANIINWGEGNIESYPLFDSLGTYPFALFEGSPCIDTGTPDTTGLFLPPWDLLHNYRVWDGDNNGIAIIDMGCYEFGADSVGVINNELPVINYKLINYPNPFNPETTISYNISEPGKITLQIFNIKGQLIETLVNEYQNAGKHSIVWNAENRCSGVYLFKITTGTKTQTGKCLLLK